MPKPTKSPTLPFKAVGGKTWLVHARLRDIWANHTHRRFFDPFVGGGAAPLLLQPERAFLSDSNPYMIAGYHWIARGAQFTIPYEHTEANYYRIRDEFNDRRKRYNASRLWLGEAFFRLNRAGYGGLWRVNRKGEMNVPYGNYKRFPDIDLQHWRKVIEPYTIQKMDYLLALTQHLEPDDFLFLDPPYWGTYDGYSAVGFDADDQELVAEAIKRHPGPVVACNSHSEEVIALYESAGATVEIIQGGQGIARAKGSTKVVAEIVACKNI